MEPNFTESELKEIIPSMRLIEPQFKKWSDDDIRALTSSIFSCGYTWTDEDKSVGFFHPKNSLILNIKKLHVYTPERILSLYERVWSKDSVEKVKKREGCYIATMVYGDYESNEVKVLRNFRDDKLKRYLLGRLFIKIYYFTSPLLVKWLAKKKVLNTLIKYYLDKIIKYLRT